jgi:hypothetical protein
MKSNWISISGGIHESDDHLSTPMRSWKLGRGRPPIAIGNCPTEWKSPSNGTRNFLPLFGKAAFSTQRLLAPSENGDTAGGSPDDASHEAHVQTARAGGPMTLWR